MNVLSDQSVAIDNVISQPILSSAVLPTSNRNNQINGIFRISMVTKILRIEKEIGSDG